MTTEAPGDVPGLTISVSDGQSSRAYTGRIEGRAGEAVLELSRASAGLMIAAHTEVPPSMAGMGVGLAIVHRLIEDARTEGFAILPLCPFVSAQYRRHPEWADVMK